MEVKNRVIPFKSIPIDLVMVGVRVSFDLPSMMKCLPDMLRFVQKYECLQEES